MKTTIDVIAETYRLTTSNCVPITLRLTKNRKRKIIRLGISIDVLHWDETKKKIKINCPNYEYIENIITETKAKYQKQVLEFQSIGKDYSLQQLVNAVEKPTKNITVEKYIETIIQNLIAENRVGNASHYKALLNSLQRYCQLSQLLFVDIDSKFLNKYETYLRSLGNKGNTISIRMRTLKATYNKAIKDNIIKQDYYPFNNYSVSKLKETTVKRSITKEEMLKVIDFEVNTISNRPQSLMQFSKDIFLFSYFGCGLNMVDIAYLKIDNILDNRVVYKRQKTGKRISFMLQPYAIEIIRKYEGLNNNYIFPILDDSIHKTAEQQIRRIKKITYVVNKNLKKIGSAIGLTIPLTTYVSRHSFATILKRSGVNIAIISEALGHSDLKTTQIYLDSFENSQIDEAMKNLL
ncbi:site-specific integrase [Dysgonomonas sp. 520]|uniref:site-specific integrase n=1 Tax=Dysgonomonas sp. 520 TaxID=2302931 RepID=UPI0013D65135|nr:site-specific integrase [Dysgonomonas sp. 520]NDW09419.1 site-specific integrase [Dysgonomonas sp. 520]